MSEPNFPVVAVIRRADGSEERVEIRFEANDGEPLEPLMADRRFRQTMNALLQTGKALGFRRPIEPKGE